MQNEVKDLLPACAKSHMKIGLWRTLVKHKKL